MLKDVTKIILSGANFASTQLTFFDPHDGGKIKTIKAGLLYGRNGSGKSTIARAFRKLRGETIPTVSAVSAYDDSNQVVALTEEEKKHIFVFDEDYIDRNVRLQPDHLETIVMLGEAADLTEKIEKAEAERDEAKTLLIQQEKAYSEFCDINNPKSPKNVILQLGNALRGDDSWAGRNREITGGRQNTTVRDETYKKFLSITPSKKKTDLIAEYKAKIGELKEARSGASTIETPVPALPASYKSYNDETISELLAQHIEKPELSDREKILFSLVEERRTNELEERLRVFKSQGTKECPYCFQPLTGEYKKSISTSIEKVLSKAVEDHRKALQGQVYGEIIIQLDPYSKLASYQDCLKLIEQTNTAIKTNNDLLRMKIENPYEPQYRDNPEPGKNGPPVSERIIKLGEYLTKLETERTEYNKVAKRIQPIIKELNRINGEIAHYDVVDLAVLLEKQEKESAAIKGVLNQRKTDYEGKKKAVEDLEAERKNIRLALDSINACLWYIFFSDDRLTIEFENDFYRLRSHGKSVNPCDVSVGERNIIGLSYFFTSVLTDKEEAKGYGEEYLFVIDDPVSSYDTENQIGILSFLKYKLSVFLEENMNTKALIMTHDLSTYYNVHKILEEITKACKGYQNPAKFNSYELRDNTLTTFSYKHRQEYTEILSAVYAYAKGANVQSEQVIGNMMRQALEAFSTFQYKKGIEEVSNDAEILQLLPDPKYQQYYHNLMYRLVLHGGSHREEEIKTMKDFNFFSLISRAEKQRTAKDILCFIYLLNHRHALEHLKDCGVDVAGTLDAWCQDILSRA